MIATGLCFAIGTIPQWVSSVWSLFMNEPVVPWLLKQGVPQIAFSAWWITAPTGAAMFATVILIQRRVVFISKRAPKQVHKRRAADVVNRPIGTDQATEGMVTLPLSEIMIRERAAGVIRWVESSIQETTNALNGCRLLLNFMATLPSDDPNYADAEKQIPKLIRMGDPLVAECLAIQAATGWIAFRQIGGNLMAVDQNIKDFNKVPSASIARDILAYTVQHIPAILVDAKNQSLRPLS